MLLAAVGLTVVAAGDGIVPGDIALALAVQRPGSEEIDSFARAVSLIGDGFPAMVVLALAGIVWLTTLRRWDLALFLLVALMLRAIGAGLKIVVNSPRPSIETVTIAAQADGLGFPSGHALGASLFYGAIVVISQQTVEKRFVARGIQVTAGLTMVLIALSRVRLGVHWPTDVIGGLLYGLAFVCLMQAGLLIWQRSRVRT